MQGTCPRIYGIQMHFARSRGVRLPAALLPAGVPAPALPLPLLLQLLRSSDLPCPLMRLPSHRPLGACWLLRRRVAGLAGAWAAAAPVLLRRLALGLACAFAAAARALLRRGVVGLSIPGGSGTAAHVARLLLWLAVAGAAVRPGTPPPWPAALGAEAHAGRPPLWLARRLAH